MSKGTPLAEAYQEIDRLQERCHKLEVECKRLGNLARVEHYDKEYHLAWLSGSNNFKSEKKAFKSLHEFEISNDLKQYVNKKP